MDGVRFRPLRDVEDLVLHEVGLGRGAAVEGVGLVGHPDVQRVAVGVGIDGDGRDAAVGARTSDADRDLAAVCDPEP